MLFIKVYRYILGYINIKICGRFKERFINLLSQQKIGFWDISRKNDDIYCFMMARDYKRVRDISKKSKVKTRVIKRYGIIFKARKYRKRWGLFIGFFIILMLFFISSKLVLTVDITGNINLDKEYIKTVLEDEGFKKFSYYKSLDIDKIEENVLLKIPELSWISINVKGVNAVVDVKERTPVPDIYISDGKGQLISNSDAVITRMRVYGGVNEVKVGDVVAKGDILVNGYGVTEEGTIVEQKAYGEVYGMIEEEKDFVVDRVKNEIIESTSKTNTIYEIFGFKIPFINNKVSEDDEVVVTKENLSILGFKLPVVKYTQTITRNVYDKRILTDEEIKKEMYEKLNEYNEEIEKQYKILDIKINEIIENNKGILSCNIYIEKNIADFMEIS